MEGRMELEEGAGSMGPGMGWELKEFWSCELLPTRLSLDCVSQGTSAMKGPGREEESHQAVDTSLSVLSVSHPKFILAQISV